MNMELTVKVMVDVTPTLCKMLEAILYNQVPAHIEAGEKPEPIKVEDPAPVAKEPAPVAEEPAPKADKEQEITNVKLRDAMEAVRKQFEFTDPNNPDAADADIHKALTHQFKEIARELGSDKPTLLPQEQRGEFITRLGWIKVNGKEVTCLPF